MKTSTVYKSLSFFISTAAMLLVFVSTAGAQTAPKKAAPAPAPKAAAPAAKPAAPAAAKPGGAPAGASTAHAGGPTTAGHTTTTTTTTAHTTTTTAGGAGKTTTTATRSTTTTTTGRATVGGAGANHGMADAKTRTSIPTHAENRVGNRIVPVNHTVIHGREGNAFSRDSRGHVRDVHDARRGMDIHHNLAGGRRIEMERRDGSRLVAERGGRGYVERGYRFHDREFARRSYYYHGRAYEHYYGRYYYRGAYVNYYTPAVYYRPAFYGWAYNPWPAPVPYAWGFVGNPWYGYYGAAYYTPYPVYPSASLWLTDYLISQSLMAAYQAQAEANQAAVQQRLADGAAGLTPDVKELIAAEVKAQIALTNAEATAAQANPQAAPDPASSSVNRMLTDGTQHVFVVGKDLDVTNASGAECAVSQGDALQLTGPPPPDSQTATLIVLTTKGGPECRKADTVSVQIADLQEMQNHMRETIDAGMGDLQAKQGKDGLPALPSSAAGAPVKASFVSAAPPLEKDVAGDINQQLAVADQAEKEVVSESGPSDTQGGGGQQVASTVAPVTPPAAPPTEISMGMTIDQVAGLLGQPTRTAAVGVKKIYFYKDMKITFKDSKVSDIQ